MAIASVYLVLVRLLLRVNLILINCIGYIIEAMNWPKLAKRQLLLLAGFLEFALNFISCYSKKKYSFS